MRSDMRPSCYCLGLGEIEDCNLAKVLKLVEVVSGKPPKKVKLREYVLKSPDRRHTMWAEQNLLGAPSEEEEKGEEEGEGRCVYKLCTSGRMRSAVQVDGNVGQMKRLTEEKLDCTTRSEFFERLETLKLKVNHDYVKEGYVFHLMEQGCQTLLLDQTENKFEVVLRIVRLKLCEEVDGTVEEENAFPGKWLVELIAKASGADFTKAIDAYKHFHRILDEHGIRCVSSVA